MNESTTSVASSASFEEVKQRAQSRALILQQMKQNFEKSKQQSQQKPSFSTFPTSKSSVSAPQQNKNASIQGQKKNQSNNDNNKRKPDQQALSNKKKQKNSSISSSSIGSASSNIDNTHFNDIVDSSITMLTKISQSVSSSETGINKVSEDKYRGFFKDNLMNKSIVIENLRTRSKTSKTINRLKRY
jgi:hypothetical protein